MSTFGKILRDARIAHNLTPSQLAEKTHILSQTITEMEDEDFRSIAAPIYGRGFVRLLAEQLELDPQPLVREFMAILEGRPSTLPQMPPPPPPVEPEPAPQPAPVIPEQTPPPVISQPTIPPVVTAPVEPSTGTVPPTPQQPTGTVPPIPTPTYPTTSETPPVASIFTPFKNSNPGSVPTVEPPVSGSVPTTEPPVTGSVPTTEPPVTGSVPTVEPPVSGSVPTTEPPVTGSVPTAEPPVSGSVPTTEPPVTGSVPVEQPTVVNGLDLFEQAAAASQQKANTVNPDDPFGGKPPFGGTVPTTQPKQTSTVTDSPYLPSDFTDDSQGPSMLESIRKGASYIGIKLTKGARHIPRSSWRKCVLALGAIAVIALIVFGCIKLYQMTAPVTDPNVPASQSKLPTARPMPPASEPRTVAREASTKPATTSRTAVPSRTAAHPTANPTPRPTSGKLQSTGQKVPSLYID